MDVHPAGMKAGVIGCDTCVQELYSGIGKMVPP
jgi:hypothetical protein